MVMVQGEGRRNEKLPLSHASGKVSEYELGKIADPREALRNERKVIYVGEKAEHRNAVTLVK